MLNSDAVPKREVNVCKFGFIDLSKLINLLNLEPSIPSVPDVSLNLSAADTTIESCLVISSPILKEYPALKNEVVDDVTRENLAHVTRHGDEGPVVTVETIHGQLPEYWV